MLDFFGIKIIESKHLPLRHNVHIGTDLSEYNLSKNRSKRLIKKLVHGTKKRPKTLGGIYRSEITHALMMNSSMFVSPESIVAMREESPPQTQTNEE